MICDMLKFDWVTIWLDGGPPSIVLDLESSEWRAGQHGLRGYAVVLRLSTGALEMAFDV